MNHIYYPGVGPVTFVRKEIKTISGVDTNFLLFSCKRTGMKIMLPEKDALKGRRKLASKKEAKAVQDLLNTEPKSFSRKPNWNQRYRQYTTMINDGTLTDTATVLQELRSLKLSKELSFGERKMMQACEYLIQDELEIVLNS